MISLRNWRVFLGFQASCNAREHLMRGHVNLFPELTDARMEQTCFYVRFLCRVFPFTAMYII